MDFNSDTSGADFAAAALPVAYIKAVVLNGERVYAIHAADGSPLAIVTNRELAFAAVRQNELEPVSVH